EHATSADIVDKPLDPFTAFGDRGDALGTEAQLVPGLPGNTGTPIEVVYADFGGLEPDTGCSDGSEADSGFGGAGEIGIKGRLLGYAVLDRVGKSEIFHLSRGAYPRKVCKPLGNRPFDIDRLLLGAVPTVECAAFIREHGGYFEWELRFRVFGPQPRTQHQKAIKQAIVDRLSLGGPEQLGRRAGAEEARSGGMYVHSFTVGPFRQCIRSKRYTPQRTQDAADLPLMPAGAFGGDFGDETANFVGTTER